MSFISLLKKIGSTALGIEHVAASSGLGYLIPGFGAIDAIFQRLQAAIVTVEANNPLDGQGKVKEAETIADFEAGLEFTQSILAASHQKIAYDEVALKAAIAAQVAAFNNMATVKASFKVVPL